MFLQALHSTLLTVMLKQTQVIKRTIYSRTPFRQRAFTGLLFDKIKDFQRLDYQPIPYPHSPFYFGY